MQPYGRFRSAALGLIVVLCSAGGCTERTVPEAEQDPKGDEADDEIIKVCEQTCPMQFECGFASEGKTLAGCLEDCPASMRAHRDKCRAEFEWFACLGTLSCEEYFEYVESLDRKIGTLNDPPPYPCQTESVARLRACYGAGEDI